MDYIKEDNCIFCKIVAGDIPSETVYEDEYFKAILDNAPAARGHVILVAKSHAANLFELPEELASKALIVAKKIATAIKDAYQCDGVNLLQNNGEAAGQTVYHFHIHVIPRYTKDQVSIDWKQLTPDDPKTVGDEIRAALAK